MELIATCAFGLEKLVKDEIKSLGLWFTKSEDGRVTFEADEVGLIKANLCCRSVDRILVKLGEFDARTFTELFDNINSFEWEKFIGAADSFPIKATSTKSILHSEPAIQSIVKKAIVTRLQKAHKTEVLPENSQIVYQIVIKANKDRFIACIDSSGNSLHKRGYRIKTNDAPMKETLAASLVRFSDWDGGKSGKMLVDPFCGSGTIVIEAALIARNIAPGLKGEFAFQKWPWIPKQKIDEMFSEIAAQKTIETMPRIFASDIDPQIIEIAKQNAEAAGVADMIEFKCSDFNNLDFVAFENCTFVTNPPYGERIEEEISVTRMYKNFGDKFRKTRNSSLFLITSREDFPNLFGKREDKNRKLFNGNIKCYLYSYLG